MRSPLLFLCALALLASASLLPVAALAPNSSEPAFGSTGLSLVPILRSANRSAVVPRQFILQTAYNATTNQIIQTTLPGLAGLTTPLVNPLGIVYPLPLGLSVNAQVLWVYDTALTGFSLRLNIVSVLGINLFPAGWTESAVIQVALNYLSSAAGVTLIEEDTLKAVSLESQSTGGDLWNLDRVDQRGATGDQKYYYNTTAASVHAYVIDTGIRKTHTQFEGRAEWSFSAFDSSQPPNADDAQGHGTHVAGTIGGATYGLAKQVRLHAVRVLDENGSGSDSSVIAGVDWVARNRILPAVAVMSLGGAASSSLDTAVKNAIASGVTISIAAGNSDADACGTSPARVDTAITVAAMQQGDARASFSNWGACCTLFAPGASILSSAHDSDTATATMSGTSMAAPHVAGAVALYLSQYPTASPAQTKSDMICFSTKSAISDDKTAPNRLLFTFVKTGSATSTAPTSGSDSSSPPPPASGNNQADQCTSSSPCEGPFSATLTSTSKTQTYEYSAVAGGTHRGWLQYNTGGGTILAPQRVNNALYLSWYNDSSATWIVVAAATDSNNQKNILFEDTVTPNQTAPMSWAWSIVARGFTPSNISFDYKKPTAAMSPAPAPAPAPADQCSATPAYDPNPNNPNNVGQCVPSATQDCHPDNAATVAQACVATAMGVVGLALATIAQF